MPDVALSVRTTMHRRNGYMAGPDRYATSDVDFAAFLMGLGFKYDGSAKHLDGRCDFFFEVPAYIRDLELAWDMPTEPGLVLDAAKIKMIMALKRNLKKIALGTRDHVKASTRNWMLSRMHLTSKGVADIAKIAPDHA